MTRFKSKENYFLCIGQQDCFSSLVTSMTTLSAVPLKKIKTLGVPLQTKSDRRVKYTYTLSSDPALVGM